MVLALCPGGVLSNVLARFAKGSVPLSISLTAVISLLSIITVPIMAAFSVCYFMGAEAPPVDVTALGVSMFLLTAVPVGLGMLLTRLAPNLVTTIAQWMSKIAILLALGLLTSKLAGLSVQDTTAVAIESGIQNGTLGIAVGSMIAGVATGLPMGLRRLCIPPELSTIALRQMCHRRTGAILLCNLFRAFDDQLLLFQQLRTAVATMPKFQVISE
jgi:BASS family bile acid:Na+ symporter